MNCTGDGTRDVARGTHNRDGKGSVDEACVLQVWGLEFTSPEPLENR